jgi:hypothetical protein
VNAFPSKVVTDIIFGHYQNRSAQRRRTTLRSKFGWTTLPFVRNKGLYRQPARNDSVRIVALTPDGRRAVSGGATKHCGSGTWKAPNACACSKAIRAGSRSVPPSLFSIIFLANIIGLL